MFKQLSSTGRYGLINMQLPQGPHSETVNL